MASKELDFTDLSKRLADAPTIEDLPAVIDLVTALPPNPPEAIQTQFVGLSYLDAFNEAGTFVKIANQWLLRHRKEPLSQVARLVDFGSGWGRITRMLLTQMGPTAIYALDVDVQMTALVNTTLPGVNTMTVNPMPPTVLGDASVEVGVAFSVFSHLAPEAHDAWAAEFGRIVAPGGMVFFTALDEKFLEQIAAAQRAVNDGTADDFARGMAPLFDDIDTVLTDFSKGLPAYAGNGGGGVRTGDFYGWAAIPLSHIRRVWGDAGFDLVEWVPSNILFPQAMVGMVRRADRPLTSAAAATDRIRGLARPGGPVHKIATQAARVRNKVARLRADRAGRR